MGYNDQQPSILSKLHVEYHESEDEDVRISTIKIMTNRKAKETANLLLDYLEQQQIVDLVDILNLCKIYS